MTGVQTCALPISEPFRPLLDTLLYKPDKNSIEWKALDEASAAAKLSPARLLERCGALPDLHQFHLRRFLFEHFPKGPGFPELPAPAVPADLPLAEVEAYSIDDAETTEIDDAFSLQELPGGNRRLGIHIPGIGQADRLVGGEHFGRFYNSQRFSLYRSRSERGSGDAAHEIAPRDGAVHAEFCGHRADAVGGVTVPRP